MAIGWSSSALDLHLDWTGGMDSRALAEALRTAIREGRLPAGARLPSTRAMAVDLGIARGTVTRAYEQLAVEGFLLTRQGAPTTVADRLTSPHHAEKPTKHPITAGRWDFRPGRPNLSAFPRKDWLAASRRALQSLAADDLDYGDPQGHPTLREALAGYLTRARAVVTTPGQIVVCNGYSEALSLLSRALQHRGCDAVDFEDPSLPNLRDIPRSIGMTVRAVPVDEHGVDVSGLHSPIAVVTPAHQYPLGVTMRADRRAALVRRSKTEGQLVIEDDYDGEFRFDRQPVGSLQGMAPDHVVYAGTASKTLAPALRLAWIALPARLVEPVCALKQQQGVHTSVFEQLAFAELISSGAYDQHIRRCRALYRVRRAHLLEALESIRARHRLYPAGISAGLHLALRLDPHGPPEREILARAHRHSVELEGLDRYWMDSGTQQPGVVIGYAAPAEHSFRPGLRALMTVLDTS